MSKLQESRNVPARKRKSFYAFEKDLKQCHKLGKCHKVV